MTKVYWAPGGFFWCTWCDHRPPKKTPLCPDFIEPPNWS